MNSESLDSFKIKPGSNDPNRKRARQEQKQFSSSKKVTEEHSCSGSICEAVWKPSTDARMLNGKNN
jgi:hypothetical protein